MQRRAARASLTAGATLGAAVLFAPGAEAANFEVNTTADSGTGSLREAVSLADAAVGDDTIVFDPAFEGEITLTSGEIVIDGNGSLTIDGPGENLLTVSGDADSDGDFDIASTLPSNDSPIFSISGGVALQEVTISGATLSGGVASAFVGGDYARRSGGAIDSDGVDVTLIDSAVVGNLSTGVGGGISLRDGLLTLTGARVNNNYAYEDGGGAYVSSSSAGDGVTVTGSSLKGNYAGGDPVFFPSANTPAGGGLYVRGQASVSGSLFSYNTAKAPSPGSVEYGIGGGLSVYESGSNDSQISNSDLVANESGNSGGGAYLGGGIGGSDVVVTESVISENVSGIGGGILLNGGTIRDSTISDNGASTGAGLSLTGDGLLSNSTVSGNTATGAGGGVSIGYQRTGRIRNSTIAANSAPDDGGGVDASTVIPGSPPATIESSVIADNSSTGGDDNLSTDGEPFDLSFSLVEAAAPESFVSEFPASNIIGVDPELGPLADNGGTTETHLPSDTSPVLDAGKSNGLTLDQRGEARTVDTAAVDGFAGATDMGSVEVQDVTATGDDDVVDPATQIDSGPSGTVNSDDVSFTFSAPGESGATFECSLDGADFAPCASPQAFTNLADGDHVFQVRAVDAAGNRDDTPATRGFTVDTSDLTPPDTQIDSGPSGTVTTNDVSFTFSAPGESGATFECSLDGAAFTVCTSPQSLNDLDDGPHTFQVRAVDADGNKDDSPATRAFNVSTADTDQPNTTFTETPPEKVKAKRRKAKVTFAFESDEANATFECSLDGSTFASCTSPITQKVSVGIHSFQVRATDAAGNTDQTPATFSFTVKKKKKKK